jgi:hypothetical protein
MLHKIANILSPRSDAFEISRSIGSWREPNLDASPSFHDGKLDTSERLTYLRAALRVLADQHHLAVLATAHIHEHGCVWLAAHYGRRANGLAYAVFYHFERAKQVVVERQNACDAVRIPSRNLVAGTRRCSQGGEGGEVTILSKMRRRCVAQCAVSLNRESKPVNHK